MKEMRFTSIGFDLDGTLLDTHRDLGNAVNYALGIAGFDAVPVESAKDLIGGGAKIMLADAVERQGGMDPADFRKLYKQMLTYYAEHNAVHTAPFPGAAELLGELHDAGIRLAVVTNKFEVFARKILSELGLLDCFDTVIGGDTLGKGRAKPAPDPIHEAVERCGGGPLAYVGDSSYDARAALAAGVPFIAAAYGYCDIPVHDFGADAVIDSLDELIPALQGL